MKLLAPFSVALFAIAGLVSRPAAAQLALTNTVVNSPAGCTSTSSVQCPENYVFAANSGTINAVTANPTTYTIGNTFNQAGSTSTLSDFGTSVYTPPAAPSCATPGQPGNCVVSSPFLTWNFQDNYEFTTPASGAAVQGAVLSFTLPGNIGLGSLEARIVATNAPSAGGLVGTSPITIVDGWQNAQSVSGSLTLYQVTLNTTPLAANTSYFLQIRGEAAASAASYSGTVTFTPVPLPVPLVLLLSGLIGLVLVRRGSLTGPFTGASASV